MKRSTLVVIVICVVAVPLLLGAAADVSDIRVRNLFVRGDATIEGDLRVEGEVKSICPLILATGTARVQVNSNTSGTIHVKQKLEETDRIFLTSYRSDFHFVTILNHRDTEGFKIEVKDIDNNAHTTVIRVDWMVVR